MIRCLPEASSPASQTFLLDQAWPHLAWLHHPTSPQDPEEPFPSQHQHRPMRMHLQGLHWQPNHWRALLHHRNLQ
jgi:hypothetical protein